jgi:hypothetical protein
MLFSPPWLWAGSNVVSEKDVYDTNLKLTITFLEQYLAKQGDLSNAEAEPRWESTDLREGETAANNIAACRCVEVANIFHVNIS